MRLLFLGTWSHGGFGKVTAELGARFIALGLDVRILAVDHRGEPIRGPLEGRVWPASMLGGSHGTNTMAAIDGSFWRKLDRDDGWLPDAIFAIEDMTGLLARMSGGPPEQWVGKSLFHYCPIEGDDLPPDWKGIWQIARPVAMSDYGAQVIGSHIGRPVPRIYHGVDTETFRPVTPTNPLILDGKRLGTKAACKAHFGLDPNRTLILRSDQLVERKFYAAFLRAMVPVLDASPETDVLMHCSPLNDGLDLIQELKRLPERYVGRLRVTGFHDTWRGLSTDGMVALMNAADLYVSTTGGEGFGLNLAEAMACEVPVIVTDWAADAEVIGPGGIMVPPLHDTYGEPVRYHSRYGMDWAVPDPRGFTEPILSLVNRPSRRLAMGREGRAHVVRSFNWDTAAAEFVTLFEEANALAAVAV